MKSVPTTNPQIKGEALEVPLSRIFENTYNYNVQDDDMFAKQKNSLEKFDFVQPIVVREIPEGYEIINGAHRYRAAQELGMSTIAIWNLGVVSDAYAQQLTIVLNELKGRPNVDSLASLIKNLDDALGREEIVMNLPFPEQAIEDMINTLEFDWGAFEAEDEESEAAGDGRIDMVRIEFRMSRDAAMEVEAGIKRVLERYGEEENDDTRAAALVRLSHFYIDET